MGNEGAGLKAQGLGSGSGQVKAQGSRLKAFAARMRANGCGSTLAPASPIPTVRPRSFARSCRTAASGRRAGAFDHIVCIREQRTHPIFHFVVGHFDYALGACANDVECVSVRCSTRDPVRDPGRGVVRDELAERQRSRVGGRFGGDHTDNFRLEIQRIAGGNRAANPGTEADGNVKNVEGHGAEELQASTTRRREPGAGETTARNASRGQSRFVRRPPAPPENRAPIRSARHPARASRHSLFRCFRAARRRRREFQIAMPQIRLTGRDCRASRPRRPVDAAASGADDRSTQFRRAP